MRKIQSTAESGFTLLELLLVVGVGALLLIGGIATYRQVVAGNQTNQASQTLQRVAASVRTAYQSQNNYDNLDTDTAIALGIFPGYAAGDTVNNSFGGETTVAGAGQTFTVNMTEVPQPACINLATAIQDPAELEGLNVNGTALAIPPTIADATGECGAGPTNTVEWELR